MSCAPALVRFNFDSCDQTLGGVFGLDRVGIRLSPLGTFNDMSDSDPVGMFSYVLRILAEKPIA